MKEEKKETSAYERVKAWRNSHREYWNAYQRAYRKRLREAKRRAEDSKIDVFNNPATARHAKWLLSHGGGRKRKRKGAGDMKT